MALKSRYKCLRSSTREENYTVSFVRQLSKNVNFAGQTPLKKVFFDNL